MKIRVAMPVLSKTLKLAGKKFARIDGAQYAAAFAYHALFSLFPLILLFVTVGSRFFEHGAAVKAVLSYLQSYLPLRAEMQKNISDVITGIIAARGGVGLFATLALLWGTLQIFTALVRATNRAWGTETHNWWQMPLKNLALVGVAASAFVLGIAVPAVATLVRAWLPSFHGGTSILITVATQIAPVVVLFYAIAVFYALAPRRSTRFSQVWAAALATTLLLRLVEFCFALYLRNFANFNVVYGALGGLMAALLWINLSGCIVIFGACLTAAQAEVSGQK